MTSDDQVWIQLDLEAPLDEYESLVALLMEFETCGFQEERGPDAVALSAFFPGELSGRFQERFESALRCRGMSAGARTSELRVDPDVWIRQCRNRFKGFSIGKTFYVHPGWERQAPGYRVTLLMEPGNAFGTGTHESTQLALRHLEAVAERASSILDIGTGSGILAMAAAKLNPAASIVALDVDEQATTAAATNFRRNGVSGIQLLAGGPAALRSQWDLVLANLTLAILADLAEEIGRVTGNLLVVSGFVSEQSDRVLDHFRERGFRLKRERRQGGWASLLLHRM